MEQVRDRGARVTLQGVEKEGEHTLRQLRVTLPDGLRRDYLISQETGRIVRERDYRAFHPAVDATRQPVETRYQGELWLDGVLRFTSSSSSNAATGDWLGTTAVRSVKHNIEVAESWFEPQCALRTSTQNR